MRGFFLGAFVLVGLDVLLKSPTSRVAAAFVTPTRWLAQWMDARTPLITRPVPGAGGSTGGGGVLGALDAGNPAAKNTNQLGESKTGACPPGFPAGTICAGM